MQTAVESADQIRIPVYDVYYALFENNVLDVATFDGG